MALDAAGEEGLWGQCYCSVPAPSSLMDLHDVLGDGDKANETSLRLWSVWLWYISNWIWRKKGEVVLIHGPTDHQSPTPWVFKGSEASRVVPGQGDETEAVPQCSTYVPRNTVVLLLMVVVESNSLWSEFCLRPLSGIILVLNYSSCTFYNLQFANWLGTCSQGSNNVYIQ